MLNAWRILHRSVLWPSGHRQFFCAQKDAPPPSHSAGPLQKGAAPTDGNDASTSPKSIAELEKLSKSAQMALWAMKVIRCIKTAQNPQNYSDITLRQRILALELDFPGYQFTPEVKKEFMKMFSEGIPIDISNVFAQSRIKEGTQKEEKYDQDQQRKLFIFCPNLLITREVFRKIASKTLNTSLLMCGSYGVSKTVTLMLLWHLHSHINIFYYQALLASKRPQFSQQGEEHKKLKNEFPSRIKKYWYWTIDLYEVSLPKFRIQNVMAEQAYQLTPQERQQLRAIQSFRDFIGALQDHYDPCRFGHVMIIDQINAVASEMRKWNQTVIDHLYKMDDIWKRQKLSGTDAAKLKQIDEQQMKEIDDFEQLRKTQLAPLKKLIELIHQYLAFGGTEKYILNSSMNIEAELLRKIYWINYEVSRLLSARKLKRDIFLTLKLQGHQQLTEYIIPYHYNFGEKWGKIDFIHFFWFEIERRLILAQLEVPKIKQLQAFFYQLAQKYPIMRYSRIMFCSRHLDTAQHETRLIFQIINNQMKVDQIKPKIETLIKNFKDFCIQKQKQKIQQFLQKEKDSDQLKANKEILFQLFYVCALHYQFMGMQGKVLEFLQQQLSHCFPDKNPIAILKSRDNNHQLIPISYNQYTKTVALNWTAKQFIEVAGRIISPDILKFLSSLDKKHYAQNRGSLGTYIQGLIRNLLNKETEVRFQFVQQMKNKSFSKPQFEIFSIAQQETFQHFLVSNPTIEQNMEKVLQKAKRSPNKYIVGFPITKQQLWSPNSPSIDFVFAKYNDTRNKYEINSFDVTIQEKPQEKIQSFVDKYEKIISDKQQFIVTHTILCRKDKLSLPKIQQDYSFNLRFAFIEQLTFKPANITQALPLLRWKVAREFLKEIDNFMKTLEKKWK